MAFGTPDNCLIRLKEHGVGAIELRAIRPNSNVDTVALAIHRVIDHGITITLHGYLPVSSKNGNFENDYSPMLSAFELIKSRGKDTILTVHSHQDSGSATGSLIKSTAFELDQLMKYIHSNTLPVRVALEINRYHGVDSPSATYEGLLETAKQTGKKELGFCWDLGHVCSSVLQNKLPAVPPPDFVSKVIHTHIHGLSPDNDTHWPLSKVSPACESYLQRLVEAGYKGIYNLELEPSRWDPTMNVGEEIINSINCLRNMLKT